MLIDPFDFLLKYRKAFSLRPINQFNFNDTEFLICYYAFIHPDCMQEEILKNFHLEKTTVAKSCCSLEGKGLLTRKEDSRDHRKKRLNLTEQGIAKISDIIKLHDQWFNYVMNTLTKEEQEQFVDYCMRMIEAAEQFQAKSKEDKAFIKHCKTDSEKL